MPYDITLTTGEMHVLFENGDTQVLHLEQNTTAKVIRRRRPVTVPVSEPGATSIQFATDYLVKVRLSDCAEYDIAMGKIDNQATWLNTQAGANACVTAIQAALN